MNLKQLHKDFGTQKKCVAYFEKIRCGKNPTCANCESTSVIKCKEGMRSIAIVVKKIIVY
jgi:hypothetical protein